jgi:hypothetical protein
VARANEGEGWGVDYLLDRGGFDGLGAGGALLPRDFADLEETYHTRIMREIVQLFGARLRAAHAAVADPAVGEAHGPPAARCLVHAAAGGRADGNGRVRASGAPGRGAPGRPSGHLRARARPVRRDPRRRGGHVTFLLGSMRGWQLAVIRQLALLYAASSRRSYTNDEGDAALMGEGIRNYSLAIMPERVLRRAFVPSQYWPRVYDPAPVPA